MTELLLCLTQTDAAKPYRFKTTGISVYSFEEVLFHCYKYWRQSASEVCGEELINWTHTVLGLPHIASRLREVAAIENFTQRFCAFLTVTPYFSDKKINALKKELGEWENRLEWEKLKEQADYLMNSASARYNGNYAKAFALYKRALVSAENAAMLNNAAIALLKQSRFGEACEYLERATDAEPNNINYALNHAEALVFAGEHDRAWLLLNKIETTNEGLSETAYFKAEINFLNKQYRPSVPLYMRAIEIAALKGEAALPRYVFRLCDVYVKLRKFEQALETLNQFIQAEERERKFYSKQADIHAACGNFSAAVKSIEAALATLNNGLPRPTPDTAAAELYTRLSAYHRLDYNQAKSTDAITKAAAALPNNPRVKLEVACVKRAQGKMTEYRAILSEVLGGLKTAYRERRVDMM